MPFGALPPFAFKIIYLFHINSILKGFRAVDDKERSALADKIQKRIQENHFHYQLIKRRDEIEKQLNEKKK